MVTQLLPMCRFDFETCLYIEFLIFSDGSFEEKTETWEWYAVMFLWVHNLCILAKDDCLN